MSISQIRTYLNARIKEVDPSYVEWRDALNNENVPESLVDTRYHINMSTFATSTNNDVSFEDSAAVVVTFWKKGFNNTVDAHDELLDIGNCVRLNSLQPSFIRLEDNIRQVESTGIIIESISVDNDNILKMSLSFNVRLFYKITDFSL